MKKKILFAMFALVCGIAMSVSLTSCSSSDDEETVSYAMGFDSVSYKGSDDGLSKETNLIENTFKKELGVSSNEFQNYPGGDAVLKTNCEKAGAILNSQADQFQGTSVFIVTKYSGKATTNIYTWANHK